MLIVFIKISHVFEIYYRLYFVKSDAIFYSTFKVLLVKEK